MMKKLLVIAVLAGGMLVSACNTLHGAARDVESTTDCADGQPNNC
jgi:predicted small secreted protein